MIAVLGHFHIKPLTDHMLNRQWLSLIYRTRRSFTGIIQANTKFKRLNSGMSLVDKCNTISNKKRKIKENLLHGPTHRSDVWFPQLIWVKDNLFRTMVVVVSSQLLVKTMLWSDVLQSLKMLTIVEFNHLKCFDFALANFGDLVHYNWSAGHEGWFQFF